MHIYAAAIQQALWDSKLNAASFARANGWPVGDRCAPQPLTDNTTTHTSPPTTQAAISGEAQSVMTASWSSV